MMRVIKLVWNFDVCYYLVDVEWNSIYEEHKMNKDHLLRIFTNYINSFEMINNSDHQEYYKWQIIKRFHDEMDKALDAPDNEFPSKLLSLKKLTENLIDSYTQPFYGLFKFAEKEPDTVRQMFRMLFSDDNGDLEKRRQRITAFLNQSHLLRDRHFPNSYLYKDDMHSVTGYLFLYDPDHNYTFKPTHALAFADCVGFYDDWGSGDSVKLDVYYRMCDQLVDAIKSCKELMATDASRFSSGWGVDPETLYADPEKHILAFDLIYCCSTYGLFDGISFERPKTKERQLMQERKEKAQLLSAEYEKAKENYRQLEDAQGYANSVYYEGRKIYHKLYGTGIIKENNGTVITVYFPEYGEKRLGTFVSAANGIISVDEAGYSKRISEYKEVLNRRDSIIHTLNIAEKSLAQYTEFLE
jgi:hypothetical protein